MTLENLYIANPCHADWDEMTGDDRVRQCAACAKPVFNLSELTRAEAEKLITDKRGDFCGRFYQRKDGTILLADCTVGGAGVQKRSFVLAAALVAGTAYAKLHRGTPPAESPTIQTATHEATTISSALGAHDSPPPPRDLARERREAIEQARKVEPMMEEYVSVGGGISVLPPEK
ncbi:MAG TPA: hypothetical protein VGG28_34085 [Kofleriaceae bacterium]|jgi:hypothetical protein